MIVAISKNAIDNYLWRVEYSLMRKYGTQMAKYYMYPLTWYIGSGRAPMPFIRAMMRKRPHLIGRVLVRNGSVDDIINGLKEYLSYREVC